jgi:hypothetical protein
MRSALTSHAPRSSSKPISSESIVPPPALIQSFVTSSPHWSVKSWFESAVRDAATIVHVFAVAPVGVTPDLMRPVQRYGASL